MKREIKFRAWDNKGKYMLDSSYGNWLSFDGIPYEEADRKYDTPNIEIERSKDLVLMQFAEKKDKNDVEIYEGDIFVLPISSTLDEYKHDETLTVVFKNSCFCLVNERRSILLSSIQSNSLVIISNIYQEPELVNEAT